jgi:hypothetical protein
MDGAASKDGEWVRLGDLHDYVSREMLHYPEHECTFWGLGAGALQNTGLVIASRLTDINKLLRKAQDTLQQEGWVPVFDAITVLKDARKSFPAVVSTPDALQIITSIDARLQKFRPELIGWMGKRIVKLMKSPVASQYKSLQNLLSRGLSFGQISDFSDLQVQWLTLLCFVALEQNVDDDVFIDMLKDLPESKSDTTALAASGMGTRK